MPLDVESTVFILDCMAFDLLYRVDSYRLDSSFAEPQKIFQDVVIVGVKVNHRQGRRGSLN